VVSDTKLAQRLLYGTCRQFNDIPQHAARARATIQRVRPWEHGRIGKIAERIRREIAFAGKLEFTTGELVRLVYCSPVFDVNFNLRKKGDPPPKIAHWMYDQIRKAAPTFFDRVGGGRGRGGIIWRLRDEFYDDVRKRKTARDQERRKARLIATPNCS
jgi:hypothetical protein